MFNSQLKDAYTGPSSTKVICIRWWHKLYGKNTKFIPKADSRSNKFKKDLTLRDKAIYDKEIILKMAVKLFRNEYSQEEFDDADIELGDWDQRIIDFDDIFLWLNIQKKPPSRAVLSVLTYAKNPIDTSAILRQLPKYDTSHCDRSEAVSVSSRENSGSYVLEKTKAQQKTHHNQLKRDDDDVFKRPDPVISSSTFINGRTNQSSKTVDTYANSSASRNQSNSTNRVSIQQKITTNHSIKAAKGDLPKFVDNFTIFYHVTHPTDKKQQDMHMPKRDLYDYLTRSGELNGIEYDEFDPVTWGYMISRIMKNGRDLLTVTFPSPTETSYTLHVPEGIENQEKHCMVYTCDDMRGMCNGELGLGAIPSCYPSQPNFKWYKNGRLVKEGIQMAWIMCDPGEHPWMYDWECVITCEKEICSRSESSTSKNTTESSKENRSDNIERSNDSSK